MEASRKFFPAVVLLLLVVVATADLAPVQAVARQCETKSERFAGLCMVEENCANVCRTEGFMNGRCSVWVRNCICIKPC
uniref:Knottins-like domain-containing protein n=1 Tax=Leersia perrieri TaxID=77586 RepID=A0A0D9W2I6_9ORYZ